MSQLPQTVREPSHDVPVSAFVDVVVAGSGPAGFAAAVAAARTGADVLVIERFGYLGGMITGAHVVWVLGVGDGRRVMARGIVTDICDRLTPLGAVRQSGKCGDYVVDSEVFKWQAAEMLEEAGARILLHTVACDPIIENGCIRGIFTESKSGRQAIRAAVTIDCTADADIASRAGCGADNDTHDVTLRVSIAGVDQGRVKAFEESDPDAYRRIKAEACALNGGSLPGQGRSLKDIDVTDAADLTQAETVFRRDSFRALYHLRSHMPGWEKATVRETLPQIGVRQSRRVHGEYVLTDSDLRSSRHFDDSVARLGAFLLGYELYTPAGLSYDIPYRCLVPRDIDGLLVAGRCISCDYLADNSMRLIVPCFATGQAAGVAAALAARKGIEPRSVPIDELQGALREQDVYLGDVG